MTGWDLARHARFDDVIAISGHGFDVHNPDGPGNIKWMEHEIDGRKRYGAALPSAVRSTALPPGSAEVLCDWQGVPVAQAKFPEPPVYDIPYRSLVPLGVDHLLMGGRCLSADFMAQSGCRLILLCMNMGEAAGTAAPLSLKHRVSPRRLDRVELHKTLVANGCNLSSSIEVFPA